MSLIGMLYVIGAILFVVFFFGFCVFIHELGHFLAAKWRGLHIVAFSIGFKKAWGFTRGGVEYRIGWIPCGGYVDLPQIDSSEEKKMVDGKELPRAKPLDRIITAAAGPLFNVLFGLLLGMVVWVYGIPQDSPKMREIVVESVDAGSPEFKAGLRPDDVIVKINGKSFHTTWMGFVKEILFTVGKVDLTVKRGGKTIDVAYVPVENPNHFGKERLGYPFFVPRIPLALYPRPDSPAEKAGVKRGDILIKINGKKIGGVDDFATVAELLNHSQLVLTVLRDGKEVQLAPVVTEKIVYPERYRLGVVRNPEAGEKIIKVFDNSPAARAGLAVNDHIVAINGTKLVLSDDLLRLVNASQGKDVTITLLRGDKSIDVRLKPEPWVEYNAGIDMATLNHPNPFQQFRDVVMMSFNSIRGVFYGLASKMKMTQKSSTLKPRHFSGPIGIFNMIYQSVYYGSFRQGIYLIVIITFSLGMINIMPLPILDGGHIVLALIELVIRRPLPHRLLQPVNAAFIIFLISFMIYVSFYDVIRILPGKNGSKEADDSKAATTATAGSPVPSAAVGTGK